MRRELPNPLPAPAPQSTGVYKVGVKPKESEGEADYDPRAALNGMLQPFDKKEYVNEGSYPVVRGDRGGFGGGPCGGLWWRWRFPSWILCVASDGSGACGAWRGLRGLRQAQSGASLIKGCPFHARVLCAVC